MSAEMHLSHIIAPVVNFSLAGALIYFGAKKPIKAFFVQRSKEIKETMHAADLAFQKSDKALEQWKTKDKNKHEMIAAEKQMAQEALTKLEQASLAEAQAQAARILEEGKNLQVGEYKKAQHKLISGLVKESITQAKAMVGRDLNPEVEARLLVDYLKKVTHG